MNEQRTDLSIHLLCSMFFHSPPLLWRINHSSDTSTKADREVDRVREIVRMMMMMCMCVCG